MSGGWGPPEWDWHPIKRGPAELLSPFHHVPLQSEAGCEEAGPYQAETAGARIVREKFLKFISHWPVVFCYNNPHSLR